MLSPEIGVGQQMPRECSPAVEEPHNTKFSDSDRISLECLTEYGGDTRGASCVRAYWRLPRNG